MDTELVLQTYTLVELLELNDFTEAEFVDLAIEHGLLVLPEVLPLDAS